MADPQPVGVHIAVADAFLVVALGNGVDGLEILLRQAVRLQELDPQRPSGGPFGAEIDPLAPEIGRTGDPRITTDDEQRSEEHTSELQSLMRISYAVFCLKTKIKHT